MMVESDATFEEKVTCGLENDMKNLAKFHQSTQNWVSKLGLLLGPSIESRKFISLKFTRVLFVNGNEKWYKIWKEIDLSVQNWHEGFNKFDPSTQKSKQFTL